jgi:hypothetical protein
MRVPPEEGAWLEAADGERHPIKGSCSLGRAGANTIVVESPKVSRRHALISSTEYWRALVDRFRQQ